MKYLESLQDALFDRDTVRELGHALHDGNEDIRSNTVDFFIAAMALGISFHLEIVE